MAERLSMQIKPSWDELPEVRRQTATFLKAKGFSSDAIDALAMVACELSENAVKYGEYDEAARSAIDISVSLSAADVTVEVAHPVARADKDNLTRLDRTVQWIRGYQDPFEAYLQRLKELSSEGLDSSESRLGLVRIAYEGQSILDFYVNERDILAVSAIRRR
jgi:hypothetical protein